MIHAGTPYLMGIALENRKRRLPSFSIEVEWISSRGARIDKRCYLKLPGRALAGRRPIATPPCRGRHKLSGFRLADQVSLRAFHGPRPRGEGRDGDGRLPGAGRAAADAPARAAVATGSRAPAGAQPPWRAGGAARVSLRETIPAGSTGGPARGAECCWCANTRTTKGARRRSSSTNDARSGAEAFELAVSRTAALCVELTRRGLAVGLVTLRERDRPSAGPGHLARLLRLLAFIAPVGGTSPRPRRRAVALVSPEGELHLGTRGQRERKHIDDRGRSRAPLRRSPSRGARGPSQGPR